MRRVPWVLLAVGVVVSGVLSYPYISLDAGSSRLTVSGGVHYGVLVAHVFTAAVPEQHVLGEDEVSAQRLRQVGVGGGDVDPQRRHLTPVQAPAAELGRYAQSTETGPLQGVHRVDWQHAIQVALAGTGRDLLEYRCEVSASVLDTIFGDDGHSARLNCGKAELPRL